MQGVRWKFIISPPFIAKVCRLKFRAERATT